MQSAELHESESKSSSRRVPFWLTCLGAGLLAGWLAAGAGELTYGMIDSEPQYPSNLSSMSGAEKMAARSAARFDARLVGERFKATTAYGVLGLVLGVVLGLTGGRAGGARRSGRSGALIGGVIGAVAGATLSVVLVPAFLTYSEGMMTLPLLFLTHAASFAGVGAAGGLALGWASADRGVIIRALIGGIMGAVVGTLVFEVINMVAFPLQRMFDPVPVKAAPRFVVHLCVSAGTAVFAAVIAGKRLRRLS